MAYTPVPVTSKNVWDFDPTSIGGCTLWMDAADPNTLFSDIAGTTQATSGGNVARWNDKSPLRLSAILNNNANSYNTIYATSPPTLGTDTNSGRSVLNFGVGVITLTATASGTNLITVTNPSFTLSTGQHVYVTSNVGGLGVGSAYYVYNPSGTPTTSFQLVTTPSSTTAVTLTTTSGQNIPVVISSAPLILPYGSHTVNIPTNTTTSTLTVVYPPTVAAPVNYMLPAVGQTVNFTSTGLIGGINTGITYFITSVSGTVGSSLTFTVSTTPGGTNSSFTLGATGSSAGVSIGRGTFLNGQQDCTMFVVARTTHSSNNINSTVFSYGSYAPYTVRGINIGRDFSQVGNGANAITTFVTGVQSNLNISSGTFNNNIQSGWLNGAPFNSTNLLDLQLNGGNWQTGTTSAQIGAFMPAYPMFGQIAEILYYNTALSNTDRQTVEGYLAWKWGVQYTLPSTHAYYNNAITNSFIPTHIPSCSIWLDAGDLTALYSSENAFTTPITSNGQQLGTWADKSGNNNYAYATGGVNPIVVYNAINNRPAIRFNAAATPSQFAYLNNSNLSSLPNGTQSGTYFSVSRTTASPPTQQMIFSYGTLANNPNNAAIRQMYYSDTNSFYFDTVQSNRIIDSTDLTNLVSMMSVTQSSTTTSGWDNGNAFSGGVLTNETTLAIGTQFGVIGAGHDQVTDVRKFFLTGDIAEIIVYKALLSTTQRQAVEGYLAWKWGIQSSLPSTHPYTLANYFYTNTRPMSRNFVPTDIDGCQVWLDAADRSTVTLTGSNVTTMIDKSGQGNNFTNASSTLTYTATLNELPVVTAPSAAAQNTLTSPSITRDPLNHTYFYVYKYPATGTTGIRLLQAPSEFFGHTGTTSPYVENNNQAFYGTNTAFWFYTTGAPFASADAFYGDRTFVNACVRQNGVFTITSNGVAASTGTNANGTGIGVLLPKTGSGSYGIAPGNINGQFAELIVYNSALTQYQRQVVEGYLCWKWGLRTGGATSAPNYGMPTTHPFYRFPPPSTAPIQPELQLYKPQFDLSDLNPVIWIDPRDNSTITTDATTNRVRMIQNKGSLGPQPFTVNSSTGTTLTLSAANPYFAVGQPVVFTTAPTGLTANITYYIFAYTPAGPTFQVTTTLGGASAVGSLSGSGSGFLTPTFTIPLAGTGNGISGPLVTTAAIGSGVGSQFLDFSNGGHYRVTGVTVGASPFTQLTLTVSPAHNGAIPVGAFVNFTATNGTYPNTTSATRAIGPFQILTATITGGTTLTITTLSAHGIGNSESVFLTINTGTFLGGGDASGLTGAYTTNASGNTGSTIVLTILSSTDGLMAITDGHVRNNVGTTGPYITQSGTTGSTVILTSYSGRASAGALSSFVGRLEYGSIPITSAIMTSTSSLTLRTPINHGLSFGATIGLGFNNNFTLPFQNSIGTSVSIGAACVQFTSATISGNTTLTITVASNPFYYLVAGVPTYTGITTSIRMTLPAGTLFSGGASATGLSGSAYLVQAGSNATTIVLTIATITGSTNGALSFTGLPGALDILGTGANSAILNSTQTTSVGTTGNTIICPLPTFPSGTIPIVGRLLRTSGFPTHTSDNPSLQSTSIFFPVNGYAIENPALSTALNTTNTTVIWVSHVTTPIMRNAGIGASGSLPGTGQQVPVIATASSINNNAGFTVNDYAIRLGSFAGNASRYSSKYNNVGNFSYFSNIGFTDSTTPFRIHTAYFNLTNGTIADCGPNSRGIASNGARYDNTFNGVNGNPQNMVVGGGLAATTLTPAHLRIGADTNATTTYTSFPLTTFWYEAGVGDILIFNSILTTEQRQLVEGFLAQKYATQANLGSTTVSANTTVSYTITGGSVSGAGPFTITINGTFTTAFVNGSQVTISGATPSGLNATWTAVSTSTTAVTFLSPTSLTWTSGGSISGITTATGTFIHPYRLNPTTIAPSLTLTNTYAQGLAAWFDAANASTIGFASSNNINSWAPVGGSLGITLTGGGGGVFPTYVSAAQNGLPVIRFPTFNTACANLFTTASINAISLNSNVNDNCEYTVIVAFRPTTTPAGQYLLNWGTGNTIFLENALNSNNGTGSQNSYNITYSISINTPYIVSFSQRSNTGIVRVNGTVSQSVSTATTKVPQRNTVFPRLVIGSRFVNDATSSFAFTGDLYEVIMFRHALTDQAIYQIEGYLAWKWGLQTSLPTTHPYYRVRP